MENLYVNINKYRDENMLLENSRHKLVNEYEIKLSSTKENC